MTFFLVDGFLAIALLIGCLRMASVHRELGRARAYHQDCQAAFEKTAVALAAIRAALSDKSARRHELSCTLATLIEEARATIGEMDARLLTLDQRNSDSDQEPAKPLEAREAERCLTVSAVAGTSQTPFAFCRRVARPMLEAIADG